MLLFYKRRRKIQFTFLPLLVLFQYMEKKEKRSSRMLEPWVEPIEPIALLVLAAFSFQFSPKSHQTGHATHQSLSPKKRHVVMLRGHRLPRRKAIFSMWHHFKSCSLNFHEGNISMGGGVLLPAYLPLTTRVPFILIQPLMDPFSHFIG